VQIKKRKLGKKIRITVIILCACFLAASLGGAYFIYQKPAARDKNVPVYHYRHQGELTYRARIKPNMVFSKAVLGPGETIYTNLLESFDAECSYRFNADKPARLKGTYSVTATLEAKDMWSLDYVLVPRTGFNEEGRSFSFSKGFPVDLAYFSAVIEQVNEQLGVNAREPKVIIRENISLEAVTAEGTVQEELAPTMTIPVTTGAFMVEGDLSEEKEGELNTAVAVPEPLKARLDDALILAAVFGLLLVLFILLTENKAVREAGRRQKEAEFWKKYGERLIQAKGEIVPREAIYLDSMEELVKVADETGRPVIYHDGGPEAVPYCYVFDGATAYSYCLGDFEDKNLALEEIRLNTRAFQLKP